MRNLIIVLVLACFLSSCSSNIVVSTVSINEQKNLTTIEMQEQIKTDTVMYKIIEKDGSVYLVNPSTKLVEKQVKLEMGAGDTIVLILCIVAIIFVVFL